MSSAGGRSQVDHTSFYRGILVIAAVAVPAFGLVEWDETIYDPFVPRVVFSGVALATVAASWWSEGGRRHLWLALVVQCYALLVYFSWLSYVHGMVLEDVLGMVPVITGAAVIVRRTIDVVVLLGFITAALVVTYALHPAPGVAFSVPFAIFAVFAGILGWISVWRTDLEEALQVANATLEARVAERTALLEREVAERVAAEQLANAASDAKSRFLANMSHELRTPLNAVIGYTELVQSELVDSDQSYHCEDLDKVGRAARHLLTIIEDVLDLTRIEAGARSVRSEPVPVLAVIEDAVELTRPVIAARRDRVTTTVAAELAVRGDRDALLRVVVHLLDNAAKFTADGSITVVAGRAGDRVTIEVRDTGIGIPEPARARVFDRFTQADDSSTRLHGGVGLGLAICKELVGAMGGTISVASVVGEGSVFTVDLPAA